MQSKLLASFHLDQEAIRNEIAIISRFDFSRVYKEFVCGELKSCVLWNKRGDARDTILESYEGTAKETEHGKKLPYIAKMMQSLFNLEHLKCARILVLTPNSVFMPHRDYLELKQNFIRIHIPLKTDKDCFHAEENAVYHMNIGEVWYLDASKIHTAASFSHEDRFHLILDFAYRDSLQDLFKVPINTGKDIPDQNLTLREPRTPKILEAIYALYNMIDIHNFYEVFSILIKKYFKINVNAIEVYDWLTEIAKRSGNQEIIKKADFIKGYCLLNR